MRILISAGDPSGDRHAAALIYTLRELDPNLQVEALGGPQMEQAGARLRARITDLPIIGLGGIVSRLSYFKGLLDATVRHLVESRTDVLVLVDYPGFNLRLAERAHKAGIKTVYYIGPQIWAWGGRRILRIKRAVDLMLVVFEFELELYEKAGVTVRWVGHPLLDELDFTPDPAFRSSQGLVADAPLVGLFPGSRPTEIDRIFPVMLATGEIMRAARGQIQLACAMAPSLRRERFERWMSDSRVPVRLLSGLTHTLMKDCDLALVASGTATLEAALLGAPELVLYRTDPVTYRAAQMLVRIARIGLVNVVAERQVVPEFVQRRCRAELVAEAALRALADDRRRVNAGALAQELRGKLGQPGTAGRAARAILELARL